MLHLAQYTQATSNWHSKRVVDNGSIFCQVCTLHFDSSQNRFTNKKTRGWQLSSRTQLKSSIVLRRIQNSVVWNMCFVFTCNTMLLLPLSATEENSFFILSFIPPNMLFQCRLLINNCNECIAWLLQTKPKKKLWLFWQLNNNIKTIIFFVHFHLLLTFARTK